MTLSADHSTSPAPPCASRRSLMLSGMAMAACALGAALPAPASAQTDEKPNILFIMGDDIGQTNISAYSFGLVGYRTPNIDRIAP